MGSLQIKTGPFIKECCALVEIAFVVSFENINLCFGAGIAGSVAPGSCNNITAVICRYYCVIYYGGKILIVFFCQRRFPFLSNWNKPKSW